MTLSEVMGLLQRAASSGMVRCAAAFNEGLTRRAREESAFAEAHSHKSWGSGSSGPGQGSSEEATETCQGRCGASQFKAEPSPGRLADERTGSQPGPHELTNRNLEAERHLTRIAGHHLGGAAARHVDDLIDFAETRSGLIELGACFAVASPIRDLLTRSFTTEVREELADCRNYACWLDAQILARTDLSSMVKLEFMHLIGELMIDVVRAWSKVELIADLERLVLEGE